jgi:hypothetical protein
VALGISLDEEPESYTADKSLMTSKWAPKPDRIVEFTIQWPSPQKQQIYDDNNSQKEWNMQIPPWDLGTDDNNTTSKFLVTIVVIC